MNTLKSKLDIAEERMNSNMKEIFEHTGTNKW